MKSVPDLTKVSKKVVKQYIKVVKVLLRLMHQLTIARRMVRKVSVIVRLASICASCRMIPGKTNWRPSVKTWRTSNTRRGSCTELGKEELARKTPDQLLLPSFRIHKNASLHLRQQLTVAAETTT